MKYIVLTTARTLKEGPPGLKSQSLSQARDETQLKRKELRLSRNLIPRLPDFLSRWGYTCKRTYVILLHLYRKYVSSKYFKSKSEAYCLSTVESWTSDLSILSPSLFICKSGLLWRWEIIYIKHLAHCLAHNIVFICLLLFIGRDTYSAVQLYLPVPSSPAWLSFWTFLGRHPIWGPRPDSSVLPLLIPRTLKMENGQLWATLKSLKVRNYQLSSRCFPTPQESLYLRGQGPTRG